MGRLQKAVYDIEVVTVGLFHAGRCCAQAFPHTGKQRILTNELCPLTSANPADKACVANGLQQGRAFKQRFHPVNMQPSVSPGDRPPNVPSVELTPEYRQPPIL